MSTLAEALRLYQDGKHEDAARELRVLVELDRANNQAWMYYGACLGQLGRWGQAVDAYRQVVHLTPEEASAHCDLAAALIELRRYDQAEDAVTTALLLEAEHPVALELRARLHRLAPRPKQPSTADAPAADAGRPPGPQDRPPPERRLRTLLAILAVLLLLAAAAGLRRPGQKWRSLRSAAQLLEQVRLTRERIARSPAEDLSELSRVQTASAQAERLLLAVRVSDPQLPEVHILLGRLIWDRERDPLATRNAMLKGLGLLRDQPPGRRRPSGLTPAQLQAQAYLVLAEADLQSVYSGRGPVSLDRAKQYLAKARAADPRAPAASLEAAINAAARARAPRR